LWRTLLTRLYRSVFHHPRLEKTLNDPQQAGICYPMLKKSNQVVMTDMIKEAFNIGLYHPLDSLIRDDLGDSTQRIVGTSARPKSV
jgi:hypothetical protein